MVYYTEEEMTAMLSLKEDMPKDFDTSSMFYSLEVVPIKLLQPLDEREKCIYEEKRLNSGISGHKKAYARRKERECQDVLWDVKIKEKSEGYFDAHGNYIVEKGTEEDDVAWIVKKKGSVHGPYSTGEMLELHTRGDLKGMLVRRDCYRSFVEYSELCNVPFLFTDRMDETVLNEIFAEKSLQKNKKMESMPFYDTHVHPVEKVKDKKIAVADRLDSCTRTRGLLKKRNVAVGPSDIFECIKGIMKDMAVERIMGMTGLCAADSAEILDVFLEEIGIQVCKDVDKDGFNIQVMNEKRNVKGKK